jgi:hypothetical protein
VTVDLQVARLVATRPADVGLPSIPGSS